MIKESNKTRALTHKRKIYSILNGHDGTTKFEDSIEYDIKQVASEKIVQLFDRKNEIPFSKNKDISEDKAKNLELSYNFSKRSMFELQQLNDFACMAKDKQKLELNFLAKRSDNDLSEDKISIYSSIDLIRCKYREISDIFNTDYERIMTNLEREETYLKTLSELSKNFKLVDDPISKNIFIDCNIADTHNLASIDYTVQISEDSFQSPLMKNIKTASNILQEFFSLQFSLFQNSDERIKLLCSFNILDISPQLSMTERAFIQNLGKEFLTKKDQPLTFSEQIMLRVTLLRSESISRGIFNALRQSLASIGFLMSSSKNEPFLSKSIEDNSIPRSDHFEDSFFHNLFASMESEEIKIFLNNEFYIIIGLRDVFSCFTNDISFGLEIGDTNNSYQKESFQDSIPYIFLSSINELEMAFMKYQNLSTPELFESISLLFYLDLKHRLHKSSLINQMNRFISTFQNYSFNKGFFIYSSNEKIDDSKSIYDEFVQKKDLKTDNIMKIMSIQIPESCIEIAIDKNCHSIAKVMVVPAYSKTLKALQSTSGFITDAQNESTYLSFQALESYYQFVSRIVIESFFR